MTDKEQIEFLKGALRDCQKQMAATALILRNVIKWNSDLYTKLKEVLKDDKD